MPHGKRHLKRYAALFGANAKRLLVHKALGIAHPNVLAQMRATEDQLGTRAIRSLAIIAEIALIACLGNTLLDNGF